MSSFKSAVRLVLSNRNLLAITLTQSLSIFVMFLWRPFWGLYILELGGSKGVIGVLSTLQAFSRLLLQLPGGMLADRYGRRRIILIGSLFGFLPPLLYRLSTHWTMLIPGIIASSMTALSMPALNALIAESLPPENRGTGFGTYTMFIYLSIVVAYPFGGFLMDLMGILQGVHLGLIFTFLTMLPIVLIQWRFISETLKPHEKTGEKDDRPRRRTSLHQLSRIPKQVWTLIVVAVLSGFAFQVFWSFVVVYCVEVIGLTNMQWSIASIMGNLIAAAFMIPSGFFTDRFERKRCIILSQILLPVSSLGYISSTGFQGVVLTRMVGGVGEGLGGNILGPMGGPIWQALVTDVAPAELRGSILGLMGTFTGFLTAPAPWVGGILYESVSPQSPFFASFALGMAGCCIFALFVREPEERAQ